jgi:hypothetical protein
MSGSDVSFHFAQLPPSLGEFNITVNATDTKSNQQFSWSEKSFTLEKDLQFDLSGIGPLTDYSVRLTLDGNLAYSSRYQSDQALPW